MDPETEELEETHRQENVPVKVESSSVYCEREWRSVQPFQFSIHNDVAMIVLPKEGDREDHRDYFRSFVEYDARKLDLPRSVLVVSWEDLVEN